MTGTEQENAVMTDTDFETTADFVEVATAAGRVRGRWRPTTGGRGNPRSAAFLGIPFAEAPTGALRFQAPVPKAPWEEYAMRSSSPPRPSAATPV